MKRQLTSSVGFLRTTAIGGLLLLLPMLVVAGLLGYVYQAVVAIHEHLKPWLPFDTVTGFALLFGVAIIVLLAICFVAGLFARQAIGLRFSTAVEKRVLKMFPKYGIYKDLLASQIGGKENSPALYPVLVQREGVRYVAFQSDLLANGLVVVYFPGAPDPWNGTVGLVTAEQVQAINLPFAEVLGICERLGRDASSHLNAVLQRQSTL